MSEATAQGGRHGINRAFYTIVAILVLLFVAKLIAAATMELRTDEAYHWTWSKEWVLSYLDHPGR